MTCNYNLHNIVQYLLLYIYEKYTNTREIFDNQKILFLQLRL